MAAIGLKHLVVVRQLEGALHHNVELRFALSSLAIMLVAGAFVRSFSGRAQVAAALAASVSTSALFLGDLIHYRAFGALPSASQLRFVSQLPSVSGAVWSLVDAKDALLFVDVLGVAIWAAVPSLPRWRSLRLRVALAAMACGLAVIVGLPMATPCVEKPWFGNSYVAGDLGLAGYHVWEAGKVAARAARRGGAADPEAIADVKALFARASTGVSSATGVAAGRNLIVLQVESLQGFALGLKVGGHDLTPNLDRLSKESAVFDRFYHVTALGRTSDAQFVSNCSLMPSEVGATVFEYSDNEFHCLPGVLGDAGYRTESLQALEPDYWNASRINAAMGFQRSLSNRDLSIDEIVGIGLSDRSLLRQALDRIGRAPEPYFFYVVTTTSHRPYRFEGVGRGLDLGPLEGTVAGDYLHAIHYTDNAIGAFVRGLREAGILDRSVLVVMGDHDGLTRRDSNVGDLFDFDPADEGQWLDVEQRVPLIVRLPGGALAGRRAIVGSQIDLTPTVLSLLGRDDGGPWMGRDLFSDTGSGIAVFPDGSAMSADLALARRGRHEAGGGCYRSGRGAEAGACHLLEIEARRRVEAGRLVLDANLVPILRAPDGSVEHPPTVTEGGSSP